MYIPNYFKTHASSLYTNHISKAIYPICCLLMLFLLTISLYSNRQSSILINSPTPPYIPPPSGNAISQEKFVITGTNEPTQDWKKYYSKIYGVKIKHPRDWYLKSIDEDCDNQPVLRFHAYETYSKGLGKRYLPELLVGGSCVFSTSNGVCFNQGCEVVGTFKIINNDHIYSADIIKGYSYRGCINK